jgi:hypothetical protein
MGVPGVRAQIKFGRIYGTGRLDYLYIKEEKDYWDVHGFKNTGTGGTRRNGALFLRQRDTACQLAERMLTLESLLPTNS